MPVWALQIVTAVSACGGIGATVAAVVYRTKLHNERWNHKQTRVAADRAASFHRCPDHRDTGLYNAPDPHQRVDLTEIGRRNRDIWMNRLD